MTLVKKDIIVTIQKHVTYLFHDMYFLKKISYYLISNSSPSTDRELLCIDPTDDKPYDCVSSPNDVFNNPTCDLHPPIFHNLAGISKC